MDKKKLGWDFGSVLVQLAHFAAFQTNNAFIISNSYYWLWSFYKTTPCNHISQTTKHQYLMLPHPSIHPPISERTSFTFFVLLSDVPLDDVDVYIFLLKRKKVQLLLFLQLVWSHTQAWWQVKKEDEKKEQNVHCDLQQSEGPLSSSNHLMSLCTLCTLSAFSL